VLLVPGLNPPGSVSDHLEYHLEASQRHIATSACVQVERVPRRATPEGPKSFQDKIQRRVRNYVAVSIRLLLQFHSDNRISGN